METELGVKTVCAVMAGVGIVAWSGALAAQMNEAPRLSRIHGESFMLARYATGGAASLYVAARVERGTVLAGFTRSAQTHAVTPIVGVGTRLRFRSGISSGVFAAVARTSNQYQARLYVLPKVASGRTTLSAIGLVAKPIQGGGWQLSVNPATAAVRITSRLQVGIATIAEHIGERSSRMASGPAAHVRVMSTLVSLEALAASPVARPELRVSVTAR